MLKKVDSQFILGSLGGGLVEVSLDIGYSVLDIGYFGSHSTVSGISVTGPTRPEGSRGHFEASSLL